MAISNRLSKTPPFKITLPSARSFPKLTRPTPETEHGRPGNSTMQDHSQSINNAEFGSVRVAWVRTSQDPNKNSDRLSQMFTDAGLFVQIVDNDEHLYDHIGHFDLIMLESFGQVDGSTLSAVESIRMGSRAPLVMLMSSYARTEMIDALQAGVDAVWALGMPREMLLARCRALLRRWKQS